MFRPNVLGADSSHLVSVILPVYNAQQYLAEAIESILRQSYSNFELLLIDDGSTDGSAAVMGRYTDSRIRIIPMITNGGLVAALNAGLSHARGSYIARMDADDVAEPDRLRCQLDHLRQTDADVCGSAVTLFGGGRERVVRFPLSDGDIKFRLLYSSSLAHPTVLGKTSCFKAALYSSAYPVSEDYDLWCRMAINGVKFSNLDTPLLRYRVHGNQISVKRRLQQLAEGRLIAENYASHMDEYSDLVSPLRSIAHGFTASISFGQWRCLLDAVVAAEDLLDVGSSQRKDMVLYFSRKIQPMNPVVGNQIIRSLRQSGIRVDSRDVVNIVVQSLLFASEDSSVFRVLRRLKA